MFTLSHCYPTLIHFLAGQGPVPAAAAQPAAAVAQPAAAVAQPAAAAAQAAAAATQPAAAAIPDGQQPPAPPTAGIPGIRPTIPPG